MSMLHIDGSQKSGSGTIVRDAVPLAALLGRPVHIYHIRARRRPPGLRPQHLQAVRACAQMCAATLKGDHVGSSEIWFRPGPVIRGGHYRWDIGTAGSTTMLAMCVLPLCLFADGPVSVTIRGGLFQDFAPTAFHFQHVFVPHLRAMGVRMEVEIVQPGYVPTGGGELFFQVEPLAAPLNPLVRMEQGKVQGVEGLALASHLVQRRVCERMIRACQQVLASRGWPVRLRALEDTRSRPAFRRPAPQPGAALAIWAQTTTGCLLGMDMAGKPGRPAEQIGQQVARCLIQDVQQGATVDRYMADQLIPYAALATGSTAYRIPRVTDHVEARLWLVSEILSARTDLADGLVRINGIGYRPAHATGR